MRVVLSILFSWNSQHVIILSIIDALLVQRFPLAVNTHVKELFLQSISQLLPFRKLFKCKRKLKSALENFGSVSERQLPQGRRSQPMHDAQLL